MSGRALHTLLEAGSVFESACKLGGDDGRTLLTCAAPGHGEQVDTRQAALLTTTVAVAHAGLP